MFISSFHLLFLGAANNAASLEERQQHAAAAAITKLPTWKTNSWENPLEMGPIRGKAPKVCPPESQEPAVGSAGIRFAGSRTAVADRQPSLSKHAPTRRPSSDLNSGGDSVGAGRRSERTRLGRRLAPAHKRSGAAILQPRRLWTPKAANGATVRRRSQQTGSSSPSGS